MCTKKKKTHTKRMMFPCLQQTSSQSHRAYPPPTKEALQNYSTTIQMKNVGDQ
jgi:hypothetical protein